MRKVILLALLLLTGDMHCSSIVGEQVGGDESTKESNPELGAGGVNAKLVEPEQIGTGDDPPKANNSELATGDLNAKLVQSEQDTSDKDTGGDEVPDGNVSDKIVEVDESPSENFDSATQSSTENPTENPTENSSEKGEEQLDAEAKARADKESAAMKAKGGQALIGAVLGGSTGVIAAATAAAASGEVTEAQDGASFFWAGTMGGALAGFHATMPDPKNKHSLHPGLHMGLDAPLPTRWDCGMAGFRNGFVVGILAGSLSQVMSGSSDDGLSGSSSSSSSSGHVNNEAITQKPEDLPLSVAYSGRSPVLHSAVAGGMGGLAAGFFTPEILVFGSPLAKAIESELGKTAERKEQFKTMRKNLHEIAKRHAATIHQHAQEKIAQAKQKLEEGKLHAEAQIDARIHKE